MTHWYCLPSLLKTFSFALAQGQAKEGEGERERKKEIKSNHNICTYTLVHVTQCVTVYTLYSTSTQRQTDIVIELVNNYIIWYITHTHTAINCQ